MDSKIDLKKVWQLACANEKYENETSYGYAVSDCLIRLDKIDRSKTILLRIWNIESGGAFLMCGAIQQTLPKEEGVQLAKLFKPYIQKAKELTEEQKQKALEQEIKVKETEAMLQQEFPELNN